MGILVDQPREPALPEPWSWALVRLGPVLTDAQQQTVLARLRAQGLIPKTVTTWPTTRST